MSRFVRPGETEKGMGMGLDLIGFLARNMDLVRAVDILVVSMSVRKEG